MWVDFHINLLKILSVMRLRNADSITLRSISPLSEGNNI